MSCLLQTMLMFTFVYWIEVANGKPLFQGFSIQKGFEVEFKPFQFKPISFFKEKWSPFGKFGIRKGIQKRDLGTIRDISEEKLRPPLMQPAPVFEPEYIEGVKQTEARRETSAPTALRPGPDPVKPLFSNLIRIPLTESFKSPSERLYTSIGRGPPIDNYQLVGEKQAAPFVEELYGGLPPRPVEPIPETQPIERVIPLITPPPGPPVAAAPNFPFSEIPPTEGPLVRGSKLALYFGNVFLQLVSQFLTNARLQFSQFSNPPPVPVPVNN